VRKGKWKLVKTATLPGKVSWFDLSEDPGERTMLADRFPDTLQDLEARLVAYAKEQRPASAQGAGRPSWAPRQDGLDPGFDIGRRRPAREKPVLPKK